jgi:hypothetical protein
MHSQTDSVAYAIMDIAATFTSPDGQSIDIALEAGQAMFTDAITHETEATSDGASRVLLFELK